MIMRKIELAREYYAGKSRLAFWESANINEGCAHKRGG